MFLANKKMILDFAVTLGGSSRGRERDTKFFDLAGVFFFLGGGMHLNTSRLLT